MKKITLIFITLLSIGFTTVSCNKDDEKETSIVGKWIITKDGTIVNGQEILTDHENAVGCEKDYSILNADGTAKDYDFRKVGQVCTDAISSYTYTRNGNDLTVTFGSTSQTAKILNLTDSELKLSTINSEGTKVVVLTKG